MAKASMTPERQVLAQAQEHLAVTQRALAESEAAAKQALSAWYQAGLVADEIELRIQRLRERRNYGLGQLAAEIADEVAEARAALKIEQEKVHPFALAKQAAYDRVPPAKKAVADAEAQVAEASRNVARSEITPAAREAMERLKGAFATFLGVGPDILALCDRGLLPADLAHEIETAAGQLLRKATSGWPEYEERYRAAVRNTATERLQSDPVLPLPLILARAS